MNQAHKILVIGADGFIGTHFSKLCEQKGIPILKYTRSKEKQYEKGYINGSLQDIANEYSSLEIIVNLSGNKRDESKMQNDNVEWVNTLIHFAKNRSLKILHLGSAGVYGIAKQQTNPITEISSPILSNIYEQTKLEADKALQLSEINFCIIRPTNVFGEYDKESKLLNLMKQLQKGRFFFLNKKAMTNYAYVGYVAEALVQIIEKNRFQREIFNVNQAITIEDFINTLCEALEIKTKPKVLPAWLHPLVLIFSKLTPILPKRMHWITPSKYRELTSEIRVSSSSLQFAFPELNSRLKDGISNLVAWYKAQNKL